jgi:hypothetical protein
MRDPHVNLSSSPLFILSTAGLLPHPPHLLRPRPTLPRRPTPPPVGDRPRLPHRQRHWHQRAATPPSPFPFSPSAGAARARDLGRSSGSASTRTTPALPRRRRRRTPLLPPSAAGAAPTSPSAGPPPSSAVMRATAMPRPSPPLRAALWWQRALPAVSWYHNLDREEEGARRPDPARQRRPILRWQEKQGRGILLRAGSATAVVTVGAPRQRRHRLQRRGAPGSCGACCSGGPPPAPAKDDKCGGSRASRCTPSSSTASTAPASAFFLASCRDNRRPPPRPRQACMTAAAIPLRPPHFRSDARREVVGSHGCGTRVGPGGGPPSRQIWSRQGATPFSRRFSRRPLRGFLLQKVTGKGWRGVSSCPVRVVLWHKLPEGSCTGGLCHMRICLDESGVYGTSFFWHIALYSAQVHNESCASK